MSCDADTGQGKSSTNSVLKERTVNDSNQHTSASLSVHGEIIKTQNYGFESQQ